MVYQLKYNIYMFDNNIKSSSISIFMEELISDEYLQSFRKKDAFLVTQMPLSHTKADLWRMMYDTGSNTLVMLSTPEPEDIVSQFLTFNSHNLICV